MTIYKCNKCNQKSSIIKNHTIHKHLKTVSCSKCDIGWQACSKCNLRWCKRKFSVAAKHFKTKHPDNSDNFDGLETKNEAIDYQYENDGDSTTLNMTSTKTMPSFLKSTSTPDLVNACMPESSKRFFTHNMIDKNNGIRNIVGSAFKKSDNAMAELEESILHLRITKFCKSLSHSQQTEFLQILNDSNKNSFPTTRLPHNINDIRSFYLSSKDSMFQKMPTPTIHMNDDHAYISLISLIDHFLAYNLEMNYMTCDDNIFINTGILSSKESLKMRQSIKDELQDSNIHPMILYINLWSDDFEPNVYRKNRKSIWIETVTICPPRDKITSPMYTYVLAIGRKSDNHDMIHKFYNKELEQLSKCTYRYCDFLKKNVPVIVKVLTISADRPERSAINHILGHNGTTTRRWLYSAYIDQDKLPSCMKCLKSRLMKVSTNNNYCQTASSMSTRCCRSCGDWDYSRKSQHLCHEFPYGYPEEQHDDSPAAPTGRPIKSSTTNGLYPVKLEYDWLKQACRFSFHNIYHGVWTRLNAHTYHQSIGINKKLSDKIINEASDLTATNPNHPNPSSTLHFPPYWSMDIKLYQCIDTPMHLLFQGIIKSVIEVSIVILKKHSKNTMFAQHVHSIMHKIKSVQCEFCRVETFNGSNQTSLGGWVAENYLGFSRVMICILSQACDILSQVNNMPGLLEYEFCIQACYCFISRIMTKNYVSPQEIDDYTKLFLSSMHYLELESGIRDATDFMWYARPNFLSILNLSEQIDQFGSIHDYWEGTHERYIQYVKPFMKNVRNSESYLGIQLLNIHNSHVLNNIFEQFNDDIKPSYERHKNVIIYSSLESCQQSTKTGQVILGIIIEDSGSECVYFLCRQNNCIGLHPVRFNDNFGYHKHGMWYTEITLQESHKQIESTKDIDQYKHHFCIGIPDSCRNYSNKEFTYTILSKNWTCRKQSGKFMLPNISQQIIDGHKNKQ